MEKIMTSKDALKEQIEEEMAAIALSINDKSVDWTLELSDHVVSLVTDYSRLADQIVSNGSYSKLFSTLMKNPSLLFQHDYYNKAREAHFLCYKKTKYV